MFAKVFSSIFDSTLAENYTTRHIFMDLLVLADKTGQVDMTLEAIARRINVPLEIVQKAIIDLCKPDVNSRHGKADGRRLVLLDDHRSWGWQIVNFTRYRDTRNEDARREYMRTYMQERRKREGAVSTPVNTRKPPLAHADTDTEADAEEDTEAEKHPPPAASAFDAFWKSYPRKVGKKAAEKAWLRARDKPALEVILAALDVQKKCDQWTKEGGQFIPYPATWLNQGRWNDEPPEVLPQDAAKPKPGDKNWSSSQSIPYNPPVEQAGDKP